MQTVTLTSLDISCHHCKTTIERELNALPGIQTVDVDVPSKHVIVAYDPDQVSESDILAKLDDEGYPVTGHDERK